MFGVVNTIICSCTRYTNCLSKLYSDNLFSKFHLNIIFPKTLSLLPLQINIPWHCSLTKRQKISWTTCL